MKTKWFIIPVISLSLGCTREIETNVTYIDGEFTLFATSGEKKETKTVLQQDGSIFWSPEDCITVFYGNTPGKFTSTNTEPAASAEFTGSLGSFILDGETEFKAIYPYSDNIVMPSEEGILSIYLPPEQTAVEGTFADDLFICVAQSKDVNLHFYNVCGGVKFSLAREDIKKVVFRGNNKETLAGTMFVDFNADGIPQVIDFTAGRSSVTLSAPNGETLKKGAWYYLVSAPQVLSLGYTMELYTDELVETISSDSSVTIRRSAWGVLKELGATSPVNVEGAVDLGLPSGLLWASCNLGASKPEEYGDYYAWGETEPYYEFGFAQSENPIWKSGKETGYSWSSYRWCMGSSDSIFKYSNDSSSGNEFYEDSRSVLDPDDDAAHVLLGDMWRMPTIEEWTELMENCTFTWEQYNGIFGFQVVSKNNGESIFLPAAGRRDNYSLTQMSTQGDYWSSSRSNTNAYAQFVFFYTNYSLLQNSNYDRYRGFSIRSVYGEPSVPVESITLNESSIELFVDEKTKLTASILPEKATHKSIIWESSDESVATVSQTGVITCISEGETIVSAKTIYGGVKAECRVSVKCIPVPDLVDLGLSVKWATFNLGAEKPEEIGYYYSWGETIPKSIYNKAPYKWSDGYSYTKYNTQSGYGLIDNKTQLDPEDDAATVAFGSGWHIPTVEEISELVENCSWTINTIEGVRGYIVHSKINNKEIFLPETSYWDGNSFRDDLTDGWYWSSSLNMEYPYYSYILFFDSYYYHVLERMSRKDGCPIRPVYGDSNTKPEDETPEPVDLGLSIKWASFNLGATKPEEFGDYYAWGETEPYYSSLEPLTWKEDKDTGYDWQSYTWCIYDNFLNPLTKYCTNSDYGNEGFTDGKTVLDPEDDAAHVNLGSKWRMPTIEELEELRTKCTWEKTTLNGISVRKITGPSGNYIYLPVAGWWNGKSLSSANSMGSYWSSSVNTNNPADSYDIVIMTTAVSKSSNTRTLGYSIRPVYVE